MIAKTATLGLAAVAITVIALVWGNAAKSHNLDTLVALCTANPNCNQSAKTKKGSVFFRVRNGGVTMQMECAPDGTCLKIESKAARASVVNASQLIAAK